MDQAGKDRPYRTAIAIHDYIEQRHNTKRRHSALDMLTLIEYENQHNTNSIAGLIPGPRLRNQGQITSQNAPDGNRTRICGLVSRYS